MNDEKQVNETKEQLRARLRNKINSKKNSRTNGITRRKGDNINESVKKIGAILANKNIESADQIDSSLIETIMSIIFAKVCSLSSHILLSLHTVICDCVSGLIPHHAHIASLGFTCFLVSFTIP